MRFVKRFLPSRLVQSVSVWEEFSAACKPGTTALASELPAMVLVLVLALAAAPGSARAGSASADADADDTKPVAVRKADPAWNSLSAEQRTELAPLADIWGSLSETRKRKWLAIAQTSPALSQTERAKLHDRMEDWAKLSRSEREQARLNFAQNKTIGKTGSVADWEAYQALSPEDRKKLADKAHPKVAGAAIAIKPGPATKLVQVPVTRHTPPEERNSTGIDPVTLLPLPQVKAALFGAPAQAKL